MRCRVTSTPEITGAETDLNVPTHSEPAYCEKGESTGSVGSFSRSSLDVSSRGAPTAPGALHGHSTSRDRVEDVNDRRVEAEAFEALLSRLPINVRSIQQLKTPDVRPLGRFSSPSLQKVGDPLHYHSTFAVTDLEPGSLRFGDREPFELYFRRHSDEQLETAACDVEPIGFQSEFESFHRFIPPGEADNDILGFPNYWFSVEETKLRWGG